MVRPIVKDPVFLARKSGPASPADRTVAADLRDTSGEGVVFLVFLCEIQRRVPVDLPVFLGEKIIHDPGREISGLCSGVVCQVEVGAGVVVRKDPVPGFPVIVPRVQRHQKTGDQKAPNRGRSPELSPKRRKKRVNEDRDVENQQYGAYGEREKSEDVEKEDPLFRRELLRGEQPDDHTQTEQKVAFDVDRIVQDPGPHQTHREQGGGNPAAPPEVPLGEAQKPAAAPEQNVLERQDHLEIEPQESQDREDQRRPEGDYISGFSGRLDKVPGGKEVVGDAQIEP